MTAVWPHLSVPVKEQALKPFAFHGGHVHALKLLHVAATDASLSVQGRAFVYLKGYAFEDFANDYESYLRWAALYRDMPVKDVLTQNARRLVDELRALPPAQLAERMRVLDRLDLGAGGPVGVDLAAVLREAGGLQALATCLDGGDSEAKRRALEWSKSMQADETWLRKWVLPAVQAADQTDPSVLDASFYALARPDCTWAQAPILEHLRRASAIERPTESDAAAAAPQENREPRSLGTLSAANALAEIGDPAAIPALIEILLHDRSGRLNYDVGHFGLAKLTGVKWQASYDGAWWLEWWEKNLRRLPAHVRGITIRR